MIVFSTRIDSTMDDNMRLIENIEGHPFTQQLTQLEKTVESLADRTKSLATKASAHSEILDAHEKELRDL